MEFVTSVNEFFNLTEEQKIMENTVSTIAFDVNGTLLDDTDVFIPVINLMCKAVHLDPMDPEELRERFTWPDTFYKRGVNRKVWPIEKLYELYNDIYVQFTQPRLAIGVKDSLIKLKERGFKLVIVSSQQASITMLYLKSPINIVHLFDDFWHGVTDKVAALEEVKERYGGDKRIAYVGDQVGDIMAVHQVDGIAIAYTGGLHSKEKLRKASPDFLIDAFKELPKLVFV